ncbi:MAG TPA: SRPBCC family protein [Rhizomicrobium sp.]|jgi:phenylpropionate dioxygenase-like ring-hydroxylating dioxygenase large terminal subunit
MLHERQIELLSRLRDRDPLTPWPLAPHSVKRRAAAYVDPTRFDAERKILFRGHPQLVALSSECREPGVHLTVDLGGVPAAIVRQRDGSLKGFVNACRHRGAPVVPAEGPPRPRFSCPYHGWVYELDGSLHSRPYAEDAFGDVPKADCSLAPIFVAEGYGLIFAQAERGAGLTADSALAGAQSELAHFGLQDFVLVETRETEWDFNWKLFLDTFTESYHIRTLHRDSIAATYLPEVSICDAFGPHPRMIGLLKTVFEEVRKPEAEWQFLPHTTTQYIFMPSGLITYQRDHVELWRIMPLSVDRTRVRATLYAPREPESDKARSYWKKNMDMLIGVTGSEDFPLVAQIHSILKSGALPELIYGRNEPALIHLHRSIDAALADGGYTGE